MLRCWMAAFAVLCVFGARAEAAELTGFGPIKFGMTKEEAWAAIGGKGEWGGRDVLRYEYPSDDGVGKLEISQYFKDARAASVNVAYDLGRRGTAELCLARGVHLSGTIETKYGISPATRFGTVMPMEPSKKDSRKYTIEDIYAFVFDNNAAIKMLVQFSFKGPGCLIVFRYSMPSEYVFPF